MSCTKISWALLAGCVTLSAYAAIAPTNPRCEYLEQPRGVDIQDPRFYWKLESREMDQKQSAYQMLLTSGKHQLRTT